MGIRVVPNETVPAAVYRVLLPHERRVITVRFHPAVLIRPVAEPQAAEAAVKPITEIIMISLRPKRLASHALRGIAIASAIR